MALDRLVPIGLYIQSARRERGLARKDLAELARVGHTTLQRIESGQQGAQEAQLGRIAAVLGLDVEDIVAHAMRLIEPGAPWPEGVAPDDPDPGFAKGCLVPRHANWMDPYNAFCAECPHGGQLPPRCPGACDLVQGDYSACPEDVRSLCPCYRPATYAEVRERKIAFLGYRARVQRHNAEWERYDKALHIRRIKETQTELYRALHQDEIRVKKQAYISRRNARRHSLISTDEPDCSGATEGAGD